MPSLRAATINPASILPRGGQAAPEPNYFVEGMRSEQERRAAVEQQQQAAEDRQFNRETRNIQLKNQALEQMANDPANAEKIAGMYGMPFDDNMRAVFSNKQLARLSVDAGKIADSMGIQNPDAARAFVKSYVGTGGDILKSFSAIEGMTLQKPEKPDYSRYKEINGRLYDMATRKFVTELPEGTDASGKPLAPWNDSRLPWELRNEARTLFDNPGLPPSAAKMQSFNDRAAQYLGGTTAPQGLPPLPTADGGAGQKSPDQTEREKKLNKIIGIE